MAYSVLLAIHLLGGALTGIIAAYAAIVMWQKEESSYRRTAIVLGFLGGFEVLTGVILSVVSSQVTSISLCTNIIIYLSIVLFMEVLFFLRMHTISMLFPITKALSPIATSLSFFLAAIAYGF
jgi:hypothetical protein